MDEQAWIDQHRTWIRNTVRRVGWAVQYVGGTTCSRPGCCPDPGDDPPFAYTIGLFGLGHPELLIHGLDPDTTLQVLNDVASWIRDGEEMLPGQMFTIGDWPHRVITESVPNPGEIVHWANSHYRRPADHSVPVLQLTYDDAEGRFPWDVGYATPHLQPRPGTFAA